MKLSEFFFLKKKNNKINIILSGGKTPLNYYRSLSKKKKNWKNVNFYLLDERLVNIKSNFSNYKNIKKCFSRNKTALENIKPLNKNYPKSKNIKKIVTQLKKFKTIAIVGMGNDGHFASIFFKSKNFKTQININKKPSYFLTEKLGIPKIERVSMNLSMLLIADIIILYLDKKKLIKLSKYLKSKKKDNYPIVYLFKHAKKKLLIHNGNKILHLRETSLQ